MDGNVFVVGFLSHENYSSSKRNEFQVFQSVECPNEHSPGSVYVQIISGNFHWSNQFDDKTEILCSFAVVQSKIIDLLLRICLKYNLKMECGRKHVEYERFVLLDSVHTHTQIQ